MTYNILLDSNLAKLQSNNFNQASHDFTINFNPPIQLDQQSQYKAALNRLITMSYSWYNIAEAYGNNKLKWRKKPGAWQTLTFPDGMYDYTGINSFLQSQTGFVDPNDESKGRIFDLNFNFTIYRVVISMAKDYELDLTDGGFASLLGYEKEILKDETSFPGNMIPNITRSVDWVFLHCDLVSRRANDVESDVLYSFSTTGLNVSYPFEKEPYRPEWHPVNKTLINSIRIWVTDGRNNILDLNGVDVAVSIMIEEE